MVVLLPVSNLDGFKRFTFHQAFLKATKYKNDVYQAWQYKVRHFKPSTSSCSQSTTKKIVITQIEGCGLNNRLLVT